MERIGVLQSCSRIVSDKFVSTVIDVQANKVWGCSGPKDGRKLLHEGKGHEAVSSKDRSVTSGVGMPARCGALRRSAALLI